MTERPPGAPAARFLVRRATLADAAVLAAMRAASHSERYERDPVLVARFRADCESFFSQELAREDPFIRSWLALETGDPARALGTATMSLTPTLPRIVEPTPRLDARVRNVYVVPEARRRGIARELMRVLIEDVRTLGLKRLTLGTSSMGRPLYEAMGFHQKEDEMIFELTG